jgi:hypothetical protein
MQPDSALRSAEKAARENGGRRCLSVFADAPREGESFDIVVRRLLVASELARINPLTNRKYFICVRAEELSTRGFTFWKDGGDDEQPEHYSVDLGPNPSLVDTERFIAAFGPSVRR